jgi:small subunit ribosomal protein S20
MPNSKQAAKRARQSEERRLHNKAVRSAMKSAMRRATAAGTPDAAAALLPTAMKRIDKAAKGNVIHRNAAARLKSRLAKRLAKAKTA